MNNVKPKDFLRTCSGDGVERTPETSFQNGLTFELSGWFCVKSANPGPSLVPPAKEKPRAAGHDWTMVPLASGNL